MKIIKSRIFKILVTVFIFGFLLGIISYFIIGKSNDSIINYFSLLKDNKLSYGSGLFSSIIQNYKYSIIIWISGVVFFLVFLIPLIIFYRGISLGLTVFNIIICYKTKGLLISLIMIIPSVFINELIYLFLSYYAVNFALKIYKSIKYNKLINLKTFCKNYFYIFLFSLLFLLISSFFEIYITSNIIKFVL